MTAFFSIYFCRLSMPGAGRRPGSRSKGMGQMGALIWFGFTGVVMAVLERETIYDWWLRKNKA